MGGAAVGASPGLFSPDGKKETGGGVSLKKDADGSVKVNKTMTTASGISAAPHYSVLKEKLQDMRDKLRWIGHKTAA